MKGREGMQWSAGRGKFVRGTQGHYFFHFEDGTYVEVAPAVYQQRFHAYLKQIGVRPTSWLQIMRRAEQEWQEYCRLADTFAENHQQWLDRREFGVFVEYPREERQSRGKTKKE